MKEVTFIPNILDITGKKFGYLTAIKRAPNKGKKTYWTCRCICGKEIDIQTGHLTYGITTSCGCKKNNASTERKLICLICEEEFITTNPSRKYCYNCRPEGLNDADGIKAKKQALKHKLIEYKGGKCEKCGYSKCEGALQFHHRDPSQKEFTIARVRVGDSFSIKELFNEVDKCDLLCANCHAEIHFTG
jgi:hypothetical protein